MRIAVVIALATAASFAALSGCGSQEEEPLFPSGDGEGGEGGEGGSSGPGGPGTGGMGGSGGAGGAPTCDVSEAKTPCDTCVFSQCCAESVACAAGTACDALWTCARGAGCLASASDFDACATAACKDQATQGAIDALEALSGCVRASCGGSCGS